MAERVRGCSVCPAPPSRGVGGLGGAERKDVLSTFFLDSYHGDVCPLRQATKAPTDTCLLCYVLSWG